MNVLCRETKPALLGFAILLFALLSHQTAEGQWLTSIDVTPANPTINVGQTQPFTATGHYSDGSTRVLSPGAQIGAAGLHTCAVLSDAAVKCWGFNAYGQLGNGTITDSNTPVSVIGISNATEIAVGTLHTCALLSDGSVKCWGYNAKGQLGNGTNTNSNIPVSVSGITTATAISAGDGQSCALLSDGSVKCWGWNSYGELGNGTNTDANIPVSVSGITTATAISAGAEETCAVLSDGSAKCWGWNLYGQLGNGTNTDSNTPVSVSGISTATAITTGLLHACALLSDGTLKCWGNNGSGQLGDGTNIYSNSPVSVSGISTATAIDAWGNHTCALLSDGTLKCWGANGAGQLGDGTNMNSNTPVSVSGISTATAIAAGYSYTCVLLSNGTVKCWGDNSYGQLGNGTNTDSYTPVSVKGISPAAAVAAGGINTCAVLSNGTVQCWGYNVSGELGIGTNIGPESCITYTACSTIPASVYGISTATAVAVGSDHSCAVLSDGTVKCWGNNPSGELGNGTTLNFSVYPVSVIGISTATAVTAGAQHSCALLSDGTVKCWGANLVGQLGDGTASNSATPVSVSGITTATAVSAGDFHTCAVLSDGTVKCWGENGHGQLGNGTSGTYADATAPVSVSGISTATAVAAGYQHTCAVLSDGTVQCWGENGSGQLGNGSTTDSSTPVSVSGISTATAVAAGRNHTCALLSDGSLKCWGANGSGQLGNGNTTGSSTPVSVSGISTATAVATGGGHTCAVLSDGTVQCWGENGSGQLGNGTITDANIPVMAASNTVIAVAWTSSDTGVATINANGVAAGLSPGTTTLTASSGSVSGSTTLTVVPTQPDLFMTNVSPGSASVNQGGTLSVTDTVSNSGTASTAFRIAYHLSGNSTYGDGDDVVIPTIRVVTSLGAGLNNSSTTNLAVPSNAPGGTYHLCALADSINQVSESDETNNSLCSGATITLPLADLLMTAVSTSTTVIAPGRTLSLSNSVKNQGGFSAGSFKVGFYLSLSNDGSTQDVAIAVTRTLGSLAVGATNIASTTLTIPSAASLGSYYVCAKADTLGQVAEADETNNTLCTGSTIQVTLPDLSMTNVTPNAGTANPGGTLSVTTTVNNGGSASGAFRIAFHLSTNGVYGDSDDVIITTTRSVSSLAAGASSTGTTNLTIPGATPLGDYYVCTLADSLSQVAETDEGNNTLCSGGTVTVQ